MQTLYDVCIELEGMLTLQIRRGYIDDFDENSITDAVLQGFRDYFANQLGGRTIQGMNDVMKIQVMPYKQHSWAETNYGDIAIVIRHFPQNGAAPSTAVGFVEAKRIKRGGASFESFDKDQMDRIAKNAPLAYYLCYDYQPTPPALPMVSSQLWGGKSVPNTCAHAIPIAAMAGATELSRQMYAKAYSFAHVFCFGYLASKGLVNLKGTSTAADPKRIQNEILEHLRDAIPRWILVITVHHGEPLPFEPLPVEPIEGSA